MILSLFFLLFSSSFCFAASTKNEIIIKQISKEHVSRLVYKYKQFVFQQRIKESLMGTLKLGTIAGLVYALYYPAKEDTKSKDIPHDGWGLTWRRIVNDACIAALVTLILNGINTSLNTLYDAFYGSVTNRCTLQILKRFLFEIKRYKFITSALKEEHAFISEQEIITAYNCIIISLEHVLAWNELGYFEPKRKNIFSSILSFAEVLLEYEVYLQKTIDAAWSKEACKELSLVTHTFLFPWIDLLTPEIPNDF